MTYFKVLILDVDGVQTDGKLFYGSQNMQFKVFNSRDGIAIKRCINNGIKVAMLSNTKSTDIVESRCKTLGVNLFYAGLDSKVAKLKEWIKLYNWNFSDIAYIGDDLNDIEVLKLVGLSVVPSDACNEAKSVAKEVLTSKGGNGVVREFVDKYLNQENF